MLLLGFPDDQLLSSLDWLYLVVLGLLWTWGDRVGLWRGLWRDDHALNEILDNCLVVGLLLLKGARQESRQSKRARVLILTHQQTAVVKTLQNEVGPKQNHLPTLERQLFSHFLCHFELAFLDALNLHNDLWTGCRLRTVYVYWTLNKVTRVVVISVGFYLYSNWRFISHMTYIRLNFIMKSDTPIICYSAL